MANGNRLVTPLTVISDWREGGSQEIRSLRGYGVSHTEIVFGLQSAREQEPWSFNHKKLNLANNMTLEEDPKLPGLHGSTLTLFT